MEYIPESKDSVTMSHEQAKVAMELGKTNNDFSLLVGGAGTGKTHLISYFLFYYCNKYSIKQFSNLIEYTKDGVSLSFTVPMGCVVLSPTGISSLNISTKILEIKDNYKLSLDITNENIMTFDKYFLNAKKKLDVEIKNKAKIDLEEELEKGEDVLLFEEDDESGFNPVFFAKEKIEDNKMSGKQTAQLVFIRDLAIRNAKLNITKDLSKYNVEEYIVNNFYKDYKEDKPSFFLQNIRLLIIDEVSMLHPRKLEFILEYVRLKRLEGWKIKVIFVGDFFQLPPIGSNINSVINIFKKYEVKEFQLKEIQRSSSTLWCEALKDFRHGVLNHLIKDIELSEDYKNQKELILFAKNASVRDFNKKNHTKHLIKNIDTKDTPHKCEVKMVNVKSKDKPTPFNEVIINNLNHYIKRMVNQEEKHICCAQPYQDIMRKIITIIKKHYNAIGIDYTECFCDNEKVMIRENQNKENKLINGEIRSYEEVKDIVYEKQYSSHIDYKGDKIEFDFTFTYQPYMLAYSMTTYKSQGLSLENEYTIASEELMKSQNAFNLLYVALSRAKGYTLPKLSCPLTQDLLDIYYKRFIEHNPLVTQYI